MKLANIIGILILVLVIAGCSRTQNQEISDTNIVQQQDTVGQAVGVTQTIIDPAVQILTAFDTRIQTPEVTVDVDKTNDARITGEFDSALSTIQ